MKHGIIVFGASGSGTTTIGRALASKLNTIHLDLDDYYWDNSVHTPYTKKRNKEERVSLLYRDLFRHNTFVMSGDLRSWGQCFTPYFDLGVFVEADTVIRVERLKAREYNTFGDRIKPGGDMYKGHTEFIEWAENYDTADIDEEGRNRIKHEMWINQMSYPVLKLNGADDIGENVKKIVDMIQHTSYN